MKIEIFYKGGIVQLKDLDEIRVKEFRSSVIIQSYAPHITIDESSVPKTEIEKIVIIP